MQILREIFCLDLRSLALLRMALALLVIWGLINGEYFHFSEFNLMSSILSLLLFIFSILLFIGYQTKPIVFAVWFILMLDYLSSFPSLNGGDFVLRTAMFWAMFLPLHAYYSIDRALAVNSHEYLSTYDGGTHHLPPALDIPKKICSLGTLAFIIQAVILIAGSLYVIAIKHYDPKLFDAWHFMLLFAFLPSAFWDLLCSKQEDLEIYYDADCNFCRKMVLIIKTFFLSSGTKIFQAQSNESMNSDLQQYNSWILVDSQGKRFYKFDAIIKAAESSVLLKFFVPLMKLMRAFGTRLYEFVANNRSVMSAFAAPLQFGVISIELSLISHLLILFFLICLVWLTVAGVADFS